MHDFRGASRTENVAGEEERNSNRYGFGWNGREWGVDAGDQGDNPTSARYAQMGYDLSPEGWSNGEIIYDEPVPFAWYQWMREHADVARVEGTMRFHSFLFGIPLDRRSTGQRIFAYRQEPVASVAWSCDMGVRRDTVGGEPRYIPNVYRVHFIMPNGVIPPGLRSVMWRVFLGR